MATPYHLNQTMLKFHDTIWYYQRSLCQGTYIKMCHIINTFIENQQSPGYHIEDLGMCCDQLTFYTSVNTLFMPLCRFYWLRNLPLRTFPLDIVLNMLPSDSFMSRMMTSSNGNIFRVTGLLCGEFTGNRWIPRTKAGDAELLCFLWSAPGPTVEQTMVTLVVWDAMALIITSL